MMKPLLWLGMGLFTLSAIVFVLFVVPRVGGAQPDTVLLNGKIANSPPVLAVAISSLGMAAGAALVGIGLGRWNRPRPSTHDGSPEV